MSVRLRLQRHGKKGKPFYWIVAADARSPRDGKYLEKLGTYNPNTNPATIDVDMEGTIKWLENGAQPSDTTKAILSYSGVLYKRHLAVGVKKGAFSVEDAEKKFSLWLDEKTGKIDQKIAKLAKAKADAKAKILETEKNINKERENSANAAEEAEIKAVSDAKAAAKKAEQVEETKVESIDDAVAAAANDGATPSEETEA